MTVRSVDFRNLERAYRGPRYAEGSEPYKLVGALQDLADAFSVVDELLLCAYAGRAGAIINEVDQQHRIDGVDFGDIAKTLRERADAWQEEIDASLNSEVPA